VIRLKCHNCGQMMKARREYAGKKGKCPNCKCIVEVPELEDAQTPAVETVADSATGTSAFRKTIHRLATPSYDEVSLFLMSITMVLIFICNPGVRKQSLDFVFSITGIFWGGIYVIMYSCGLALSIYHIFSSRQKNNSEKYLMMFFAVLTNGISGICAGVYVFKNSIIWLAVLPIWNIVSGAVLILMLWGDIIRRQCISDQDATIVQAVIGLAAILAIFFICSYLLGFHWAITFSICVAYSTSFDRVFRRLYHRMHAPEG